MTEEEYELGSLKKELQEKANTKEFQRRVLREVKKKGTMTIEDLFRKFGPGPIL